ncbi:MULTISPECIES: TetR/AcrR family transcriptional regulator [Mycolicibacter]|uniref:TetR/AcrR family transcriptional regulator n=1 Tax=Mycolicibacter virginiensis TaxID=1795032 RepID=A0A9X7IKJ9_9MYCO|nr:MULTISPECIES: TetR/AcrR family transcriptional regulator [Mycobacteriaceae]OBG34469.1 transcriptional regulator [Mycolicibacter heraklionensis]PQM50946.1 TetR/AcrR family transcriptional regulator [Mycolicibacter virginiensis]
MPEPAANRSRAEHLGPERRRPQVLDAALQIAAEHGVAGVTMKAIAERIGVTRPVVYACYDGRGEVLAALLDRETELMLTSLLGALPPQRASSVEDRFVAGFRAFLSAVRERPASWRIIFSADQDPVLAAAVVSGRARLTERVATVMQPLVEHRAPTTHTLAALTEVFLAICEAAARMLLDGDQQWTPESLAAIVGPAAYRTFEI